MSEHVICATYERTDPDTDAVIESDELRIHFRFTGGSPEHWNRAIGTWLPADPDEIEIIRAEQDLGGGRREPACQALSEWAESWLAEHEDEAIERAIEDLRADADDAAERRAEERRELAREDARGWA